MRFRITNVLPLFMAAMMCVLTAATVGRSAEDESPSNSVKSETVVGSASTSTAESLPAENEFQNIPSPTSEFESFNRSQPTDAWAGRDPAFSKYVDLSLLEKAVSELNASLLTDVALGLAEGERILVRSHKSGLTSDKLVAKAAALALRKNDQDTIKRLEQAADTLKKPSWTKALADAKEFGAKSRDSGPSVSLSTLDLSVVELSNAVHRATDASVLTPNKDDLENLKKAVSESVKDEKIKAYLVSTLDTTLKSLPAKSDKHDPADDVLAEFAAGSRQIKIPPWITNPILTEQGNGYYEFSVHNNTPTPMWVAVNCYKSNGMTNYWGIYGWWRLQPGETAYLQNTKNRYIYVYAHNDQGRTWGGNYQHRVWKRPMEGMNTWPINAYNQYPADSYIAGFLQVDMGGTFCKHTLNLNP